MNFDRESTILSAKRELNVNVIVSDFIVIN